MSASFDPIEIPPLNTCNLETRKSKVARTDFAQSWKAGSPFSEFMERLPNILAAGDFKTIVSSIVKARDKERPVMMAMGAHVIKVGLNPVVIDLMHRGIITAVAFNGAGIIHDLELAMVGKTSEDVQEGLADGAFGMAKESAEFLNEAITDGERLGIGLGRAVGRAILKHDLPFADDSILAQAARMDLPATVHVAIGTDIIHMHPNFNPAAVGKSSHLDFRLFASVVGALEGGVYLNVGSAVILPEVFLKALTLVRNLGKKVDQFTTINMDFIRHYRPVANVVCRPTSKGGAGFNLIGHHEIMFPLLAAAVIEKRGRGDI